MTDGNVLMGLMVEAAHYTTVWGPTSLALRMYIDSTTVHCKCNNIVHYCTIVHLFLAIKTYTIIQNKYVDYCIVHSCTFVQWTIFDAPELTCRGLRLSTLAYFWRILLEIGGLAGWPASPSPSPSPFFPSSFLWLMQGTNPFRIDLTRFSSSDSQAANHETWNEWMHTI